MPSSKSGNIIKYTVSSLLAILFIWLVVRKVDWMGFWSGLQQTRWGFVVLFLCASLTALVFRTLRWRQMVKPADPDVKALDTWDAVNVGALANIALPGAGEFIRCGYVSRRKDIYGKVIGTVVMERIWDVLAIGVLIIFALALKWSSFGPFVKENLLGQAGKNMDFSLWWVIAVAVVIIALLSWVVIANRERSKLCGRVYSAVAGIFQGAVSTLKMKRKGLFALYTVLIWFAYVMMSWFGLKAVPELSSLTIADALFISAVGNLASVIPVPSGMGPYHYLVMTSLTALYGCTSEIGLLYAVLCHEIHSIFIIVLGVLSYARLSLRKNKSV